MPEVTDGGPVDGRAARAQRTRGAVVDALLELNEEGVLRPTAKEIAERAGVSLRSVYVHFDDLEDLFCAAGQRHFAHVRDRVWPLPDTGPLDARIDAFVAQRAELLEEGRGVYRAAILQEPFSPSMAKNMAIGRKLARTQVAEVFASELAAAATAPNLLDALEVVTNAAAWETLRHHRHLTPRDASEVMRSMLRALLRNPTGRDWNH